MCGGAIDGTHVPILAPNERHADYVKRKGYTTVLSCRLWWITITCTEML